MNEYHASASFRIMDTISLLQEMEITVNDLAQRYDVPVDIVLEDLKYIDRADDLGIDIVPSDENESDDFFEELLLGRKNDSMFTAFNGIANHMLSIQLSTFENIFLSSFLEKNGHGEYAKTDIKTKDIHVKKLYGQIQKKMLTNLPEINEAIEKRVLVELVYQTRKNTIQTLLVFPVTTVKVISGELFYLVAFSGQKVIHLRLDRIKKIIGFREPEAPADNEKISEVLQEFDYRWGMGAYEPPFPFELLVYDEANVYQRLREELRERKYGKWKDLDHNRYIYYDKVIGYNSLKTWVLGWGSSVKVINPPELARDILTSAKERKAKYESY